MRQFSWRKRVPGADKKGQRQPHSHKNSNLNNHNIHAEDLAQTHSGSVMVTSVSESTYESCLGDFVETGLLCDTQAPELGWCGWPMSSRHHLPVSASPELGLQEYSTALCFLLGYRNPPAMCASGS